MPQGADLACLMWKNHSRRKGRGIPSGSSRVLGQLKPGSVPGLRWGLGLHYATPLWQCCRNVPTQPGCTHNLPVSPKLPHGMLLSLVTHSPISSSPLPCT